MAKINSVFRFIRAAFSFSNPVQLVASKILSRSGVIVYRYGRYRLSSLESCADGVSIRECLAEKAYHEALIRSKPSGGAGSYVNLGANIGAFDVAVHDVWQTNVKGVAVEMNPWTCDRLSNNISLNRFETRVMNAAVADKEGVVRINIQDSGPGQSVADFSGPGSTEVKALPLSAIPDPAPGADVDLLKMDCEGSEYAVLAAARPEDLKRFKNIVMEIHPPPPGYSQSGLIEEVTRKGGYQASVLSRKEGAVLMFFSKEVVG